MIHWCNNYFRCKNILLCYSTNHACACEIRKCVLLDTALTLPAVYMGHIGLSAWSDGWIFSTFWCWKLHENLQQQKLQGDLFIFGEASCLAIFPLLFCLSQLTQRIAREWPQQCGTPQYSSWLVVWTPLKNTSSTAQGGGGSFKNRKPIGELGCCESGMAERSHWWTERCLRSPLFRPLSLTIYLPTYLSSMYLSIYRSIYLSLSLSLSSVYLSSCLPVYLSIYLSICLSIYLSLSLSLAFICLSV